MTLNHFDQGKLRDATTQQLFFALVGPKAPKNLRIEPNHQSLYLEWDLAEADSADSFRFYCAENQHQFGGCTSSDLEPYTESATRLADNAQAPEDFCSPWLCGQTPPAFLLCGQALNAGSTQGVTDATLTNGKSYAVAIAGVDAFGNVGPLTDPVCSTPSSQAATHRVTPTFSGYPITGDSSACSLGHRRHVGRASRLLALFGVLVMSRRGKRRANNVKSA